VNKNNINADGNFFASLEFDFFSSSAQVCFWNTAVDEQWTW